MKKTLIALMLVLSLAMVGCGDDKYTVTNDSKLTKDDMQILQKDYEKLEQEEKTRMIIMESDMTDEERDIFKDDLKRLYMEEMEVAYGSKDEAAEVFEVDWDLETRKRSGNLTEEEIAEDERFKQEAKDTISKKSDYDIIRKRLQEAFDEKEESEDDVTLIEITDLNSSKDSIDVKLQIKSTKGVNVGDVYNLRDYILGEVREQSQIKKVKVDLYMGSELKDSYEFNSGWDKDVTP